VAIWIDLSRKVFPSCKGLDRLAMGAKRYERLRSTLKMVRKRFFADGTLHLLGTVKSREEDGVAGEVIAFGW
jgi:hypothetical protein